MAWLRSGDGPLSVRVRPSGLKHDQVERVAIRSMTSSQATASSSLEALAATADAAARAALHTLNIAERERHCQRARKARPKFRHTAAIKKTVTGKPRVTMFAPGFS